MAVEISKERTEYSLKRLNDLKKALKDLPELKAIPNLTIFAAGSYARLEASKYSDIDMFFLSASEGVKDEFPRTNSLRMFGKMIDVISDLGFPRFSKVFQGFPRFSKVFQGFPRFSKVFQGFPMIANIWK